MELEFNLTFTFLMTIEKCLSYFLSIIFLPVFHWLLGYHAKKMCKLEHTNGIKWVFFIQNSRGIPGSGSLICNRKDKEDTRT